ncbi:hypothetical protein ETB97_010943, partial [Aspergillus alliaceus]
WNQRTNSILKSKYIIGCTTTAAAMYTKDIRAVSPGIVLLKEAGEILESHVLAAMNFGNEALYLLRDQLKKDNDPVLNDLDSHDLVKAGLLSQASADYSKRAIRLSTIDNYQGKKYEVVISTLTHSNNTGDIGFIAVAQQLNVLLSHARNILFMVGNVKTFINSQKGKDVWTPFMNNLKEKGHLFEQVKDKFLTIKTQVDTALRQGIDLSKEQFGSVLIRNLGTGKTTVARLYTNFLSAVRVLPGSYFVETSGSILMNKGVPGCQKKINTILNSGSGGLFIDKAYQLTEGQTQGAQVMNFLLAEVENQTRKMAVVLAGYRIHMEKFFAHNPGQPSRFPHEFKFEDCTDNE